jgi:hypothetical protein
MDALGLSTTYTEKYMMLSRTKTLKIRGPDQPGRIPCRLDTCWYALNSASPKSIVSKARFVAQYMLSELLCERVLRIRKTTTYYILPGIPTGEQMWNPGTRSCWANVML